MDLIVKEIPKEATQALNLIKEVLDNQLVGVYLYGSAVMGGLRVKSDVDILVELDYSQRIGWGLGEWQMDLKELLKKPVGIVTADGLWENMWPIVNSGKILLYESHKNETQA